MPFGLNWIVFIREITRRLYLVFSAIMALTGLIPPSALVSESLFFFAVKRKRFQIVFCPQRLKE